ncbi:Glutamine cyclotransferase [Ignavigranum ruoffiae]|uniref:Glutamine cyclotransferase n=1 Tax=Ignavigranum ruoffiae TaxID=89093 RepID=A0A1H8ZTW4_9LACT|nr:glutaminyl-peptide cyclotransferase [Ignavigranum ruoffiae]SEP67814.1 Glutamine cyclotransferase [Ignavigranum ruoffiae]
MLYCILSLFMMLNLSIMNSPVKLVSILPSDQELFTQGFTVDKQGRILIGSGQYDQSQLGYLNPDTGTLESKVKLANEYFGEGITDTPYGIWQLTWKSGKAFLWDEQSFELTKEVAYDTEGWGLTYDAQADVLWMSDGSSTLYQRDAQNFDLLAKIQVHLDEEPVELLNELEYANGLIYANVWYSNSIVAIDGNTGEVKKVYDLSPIIDQAKISPSQRQTMDVLNGIAHIKDNLFYLTGKYYPIIFEVELN